MIKELDKLRFKSYNIDGVLYYKKGSLIIEKVYKGFLCKNPYKKINNVKELKKIITDEL